FFGPFDYETLPAPVHAQYRRWITLAGTEIKGPLPVQKDYRFATYVKTDEERARMSSGWVRNHTDPRRVISVTLETAWNTPASTAEGYLTVGGQLGRTVARYLEKELDSERGRSPRLFLENKLPFAIPGGTATLCDQVNLIEAKLSGSSGFFFGVLQFRSRSLLQPWPGLTEPKIKK
ncbi:MAG: hypothetical protein KDM64_20160, partial [Verrucomicrobiae bacterium]|nr:hypothetical protein [Verrucomicrobiae bacterium]